MFTYETLDPQAGLLKTVEDTSENKHSDQGENAPARLGHAAVTISLGRVCFQGVAEGAKKQTSGNWDIDLQGADRTNVHIRSFLNR